MTRPARPVPAIALMSTLCSAAIFRTNGVDLRCSRSSTDSIAPFPPVASLNDRSATGSGTPWTGLWRHWRAPAREEPAAPLRV